MIFYLVTEVLGSGDNPIEAAMEKNRQRMAGQDNTYVPSPKSSLNPKTGKTWEQARQDAAAEKKRNQEAFELEKKTFFQRCMGNFNKNSHAVKKTTAKSAEVKKK